jgi:hypothetical protein
MVDEREGPKYINYSSFSHSEKEFFIDFSVLHPSVTYEPSSSGQIIPERKVVGRFVLTPQHAKEMLRILTENLKTFENKHGPIGEVRPTMTLN